VTVSLEALVQDLRYALRSLRGSRGFSAGAVAIVAIGTALNIGVFTVVRAAFFNGFRSVDRNDRILYIGTQKNGAGCCVSYPDLEDWRAGATTFQSLGAVADLQITLTEAEGRPEHYDASLVTANTFAVLGRAPILGRDFASSDEQPGAPPVAILRYELWQRRYGADPAVVGQRIRINGTSTTVIGVMPAQFAFPQNQDLWLPLVPTADRQRRDNRGIWFAFGRLKDDATFETARAELAVIGRRLANAHPDTNEGWTPSPRTFAQFFIDINAGTLYGSLWAAVAFVLLIACANLANLQLARAIVRTRDTSLRLALGASRSRIVRPIVLESVLLSVTGGILGWVMATWGIRGYEAMANPPTRSWSEHLLDYRMDTHVLLYALAISIGTGLIFGLAPMLRLSRLDVHATLKDGGRGAAGSRNGTRLSFWLVTAQLALGVVLIAGAVAMTRSVATLSAARQGVDARNILTGLVVLSDQAYPNATARRSFFDRLQARLSALPGVESVAVTSVLPVSGPLAPVAFELGDVPGVGTQNLPRAPVLRIGPRYFRMLKVGVSAGREFQDDDAAASAPVAIVNQAFARRFWPGDQPIGKRLRLRTGDVPGPWLTVVGVASDISQDLTRQRRDPLVYVSYRQQPEGSLWILARTRVAPGSLVAVFRHELQAVDPALPFWLGPDPLPERLAGMGNYWNTRNNAVLLLVFASIGLLLASVGLYAVVAYALSQRTQEIGVRMALGATAGDILRLILRQGLLPAGIGLTFGLAALFPTNWILRSQLVGVSAADPITVMVVSVVLIASALVGCLIPARRATRVSPLAALRFE
jgi:predicted permease